MTLQHQIDLLKARVTTTERDILALQLLAGPVIQPTPPSPPAPPAPPQTSTNGPTLPLTLTGPREPSGNTLYENLAIQANKPYLATNGSGDYWGGQGVSCGAGTGLLTLRNCSVESYRYGIWCEGNGITLDHCAIHSNPSGLGDGDDYCCRGSIPFFHSNDSSFKNSGGKAVVRIYGCPDFQSLRDIYHGGTLKLGGGAQSEWDNALPFAGTLTDCKISCESIQVYQQSNVTFIRCDFTGSGPISINGGHATFKDCTLPVKLDGSRNVLIGLNSVVVGL